MEPYVIGRGIQITDLAPSQNGSDNVDNFLLELTSLSDTEDVSVQLALPFVNSKIRQHFEWYGFIPVVDNSSELQMERNPNHILMKTMESAPPNKKAEKFIKSQKSSFKKRYGKNWKRVLYATAWKRFNESLTVEDYLLILSE